MSLDNQLLERIVQEVMEQIRGSSTAPRPSSPPPKPPAAPAASVPPGALAIAGEVITADLLREAISGQKKVTVGPRAVLTPSAHDFLRSRGISWSRRSAAAAPESTDGRWRVVVSAAGGSVQAALDHLQQKGFPFDRELSGGPAEAARLAASLLCRAEAAGVVALVAEASLVACLANRNRQVRAAEVADLRSLASARQQLGANLLCLNPDGKSFFELRNLLQACVTGGKPQEPPALFRE
jgi:hypothetical protein